MPEKTDLLSVSRGTDIYDAAVQSSRDNGGDQLTDLNQILLTRDREENGESSL